MTLSFHCLDIRLARALTHPQHPAILLSEYESVGAGPVDLDAVGTSQAKRGGREADMTFGQYLRVHRHSKDDTLQHVVRRAKRVRSKPRGTRADRGWFCELEADRADVRVEWLPFIALAYDADLLALMYVHPAPVGGMAQLNPADVSSGGFQPLPFKLSLYGDTKGATYLIPTQRLDPSDLVLVFLILAPGGHSPKSGHWHPGDEVVRVEQGLVRLVFPDLHITRDLGEGEILHFDASREHYVENPSDAEARIFIVRGLRY